MNVGQRQARGNNQMSPRIDLHCFPYAGGGALAFRGWQAALPPTIAVRVSNLPGREEFFGEAPLRSLKEAIGYLLETLVLRQQAPYAVFGHSMGTIVGFELLREIRRRGGPMPVHLFVSGMNAPQTLRLEDHQVHRLGDQELLAYLRALGGAPDDLLQDKELQRFFLPVLRADFELAGTFRYVPDEPFGCPISAWGGDEDISTTREGLEAWDEQTTMSFRLRMLPGRHLFLQSSQHELLAGLSVDLSTSLQALRSWAG
jgi:medium-chain acyl-[acyl-carrier-protein] hydrolase